MDGAVRTVPVCVARGCDGIATVAGLCDAHRRARTFSSKMQDAAYEFLHKQIGNDLQSSVKITTENMKRIEDGGQYLAEGLALFVSACFDTDKIAYEPIPISARMASNRAGVNWRVDFRWNADASNSNYFEDEDELDDDEEFEDDP